MHCSPWAENSLRREISTLLKSENCHLVQSIFTKSAGYNHSCTIQHNDSIKLAELSQRIISHVEELSMKEEKEYRVKLQQDSLSLITQEQELKKLENQLAEKLQKGDMASDSLRELYQEQKGALQEFEKSLMVKRLKTVVHSSADSPSPCNPKIWRTGGNGVWFPRDNAQSL